MIYCTKCGSPLSQGSFCPNCGSPATTKAHTPEVLESPAATERAKRGPNPMAILAALVLTGVVAAGAVVLVRSDEGQQQLEGTPVSASAPPTDVPRDTASPPVSTRGCGPAPTAPTDPQSWAAVPEMTLVDGADYQLVLTTNCGEVVIDTYADKAPETVNAMLWLAGESYFDSTLCHRLVTGGIKVLQCGDPTATGTGGPGFELPDENLPASKGINYPAGTVAMANAGPGTSGSQFFIVYEDTTLPPSYTIWGEVSSGLDIVEDVAQGGVSGGGSDGSPATIIGFMRATARKA